MLRGRVWSGGAQEHPQSPPPQLWLLVGQPQPVPLAAVPVAQQEQAVAVSGGMCWSPAYACAEHGGWMVQFPLLSLTTLLDSHCFPQDRATSAMVKL